MQNQLINKIHVSPLVQDALKSNQAVVALESTVITHGLPFPENLSLLRQLEQHIIDNGAIPATIIVWQGYAYTGIDDTLLDKISQALSERDKDIFHKLGVRDLPLAIARKQSGGTTVSATMALAAKVGIEVFATGGIGGAHRGWQATADVSSDLSALSTYPVAVVSAGCKAILDVAATLEILETMAVPVWGWQTNSFPLFYSSESDYQIDSIDGVDEFVSAWHAHRLLSGDKGVLVANPIPKAHEIQAAQMEPIIQAAVQEADMAGVHGKAITPFLLDYLARHTEGDSVKANLALIENNAVLAARLAKALKG